MLFFIVFLYFVAFMAFVCMIGAKEDTLRRYCLYISVLTYALGTFLLYFRG